MTSDSTLIHDAELPADSTDAPDEWVELGRTAGAYGFKGWVRIAPLASGEVLEHTRNWELVDTAGVRTPVRVKGLRRHGAGLIAKWDLVGCTAVNKDGVKLGTILSIGTNGAQDLFEIEYVDAAGIVKRFFIPNVKDVYVVEMKPEEKRVVFDWDPAWR